jgi:hypothetical protein
MLNTHALLGSTIHDDARIHPLLVQSHSHAVLIALHYSVCCLLQPSSAADSDAAVTLLATATSDNHVTGLPATAAMISCGECIYYPVGHATVVRCQHISLHSWSISSMLLFPDLVSLTTRSDTAPDASAKARTQYQACCQLASCAQRQLGLCWLESDQLHHVTVTVTVMNLLLLSMQVLPTLTV